MGTTADAGNLIEHRKWEPCFRRASHVCQAEHAGTVVLFDGQRYFTLANDTAMDLWSFLAFPHSVRELAGLLSEKYDASPELIAADVAAQLARMSRHRLVEAQPS